MISNPITEFVTGNDEKSFTYEGGTQLYHFSPEANGLSDNMECNVIFFANDEVHALDVLKRMFEFVMVCNKEYIEHSEKNPYKSDMVEWHRKNLLKFYRWVKALESRKIKVELAPTNQFYKVGWASNDTIV